MRRALRMAPSYSVSDGLSGVTARKVEMVDGRGEYEKRRVRKPIREFQHAGAIRMSLQSRRRRDEMNGASAQHSIAY